MAFTLLMGPAYSGDLERAKILLGIGADVKIKSPSGETTLNFALLRGHKEIAETFRKKRGEKIGFGLVSCPCPHFSHHFSRGLCRSASASISMSPRADVIRSIVFKSS